LSDDRTYGFKNARYKDRKLVKSGAETEIYRNLSWRVGGRYVVFLISVYV